jgi:hypothetical protein
MEETQRFVRLLAGITLVVLGVDAHAQCATDRVEAADAQNFSQFGRSVAISGNRIVVGEPNFERNGQTPGAAYVYELSRSGWTQQAQLLASDGRDFDDFGVAVAIDGDTILVAADSTDGPMSGAVGAVYVYSWTGSEWVETQKLIASDGARGGFYGGAVALEGDTAVIGRYWDSVGANHSGSAYVFTRSGSTWSETQKLLAPNAAPEDNMGFAVAISGDTIVVGAPNRFSAAPDDAQVGRAFVYARTDGLWELNTVLRASNAAPFDQFGISVAIDGERIAVGAWQDSFFPPTSGPGEAYLFERTDSAWQETQIFAAPDPHVQAEYGGSVAIEGPWFLIGAPSHPQGNLWGAVYSYHQMSGSWGLTNVFLPDPNPSLSWMGNALAMDGNYAVAGAFIESLSEEQNGTSYVLGGFDAFVDEGFALAGTGGPPRLTGVGTACAGSSVGARAGGRAAEQQRDAVPRPRASRSALPWRHARAGPARGAQRTAHERRGRARHSGHRDPGHGRADGDALRADLDRRSAGTAGPRGVERDLDQCALTRTLRRRPEIGARASRTCVSRCAPPSATRDRRALRASAGLHRPSHSAWRRDRRDR